MNTFVTNRYGSNISYIISAATTTTKNLKISTSWCEWMINRILYVCLYHPMCLKGRKWKILWNKFFQNVSHFFLHNRHHHYLFLVSIFHFNSLSTMVVYVNSIFFIFHVIKQGENIFVSIQHHLWNYLSFFFFEKL